MRYKITSALLTLLLSTAVVANGAPDCGFVNALRQEWHEVPVTILIPEDGSIPSFRVGSLYKADHSKFTPANVIGAVCVVPLMFDQRVLDAIVAGAKQGELKSRGADIDDQMESVYEEINSGLDSLFAKDGLPKGSGLSKVLWHLGNELSISSASLSKPNRLTATIQQKGIISPNHQIWYVLAEFLDGRGVEPEFINRFVASMREEDRSTAPLSTKPG